MTTTPTQLNNVIFGSGRIYLTDSSSVMQEVATVTDVSLDRSGSVKALYGNQRIAIDMAETEVKYSGKIKSAKVNGQLLNSILMGSLATGMTQRASETNKTPDVSAHTVQAAKTTTFLKDLGASIYATGLPMVVVGSNPVKDVSYEAGAVGVGLYTFAATQAEVNIAYEWTDTTGQTITIANLSMGAVTSYVLELFNTYNGASAGFKLLKVAIPKLSLGFKVTDYVATDLDFECFCDSTGALGTILVS